MNIGKGILGVVVALSVTLAGQCPVWANHVDFLRTIPLEISHYEESKAFPERFQAADEVLQAMDSTSNLLVHMEVLRRGYHDLAPEEQEKLLDTLSKRHQEKENDFRFSFDHGYAQLVYKHNKTGLFFLRKANDRFKNQFSSLAYAMAEAEADINLEGAAPEVMTTRKLDVTFKLTDAVRRDAENHQPGFWPTYVRVIEKLKPIEGYGSFAHRDFSLTYLPYGNSVVPMRGATQQSLPMTEDQEAAPALLSNALNTACDPNVADLSEELPPGVGVVAQRSAMLGDEAALIQFFNTDEQGLYRVRITGQDGRPMLSFKTYAMPTIVEDLEGDGTYEIVARQYRKDPMNPVLVYRQTPCGFELDQQVYQTFNN